MLAGASLLLYVDRDRLVVAQTTLRAMTGRVSVDAA
jgi:hypothetical protein